MSSWLLAQCVVEQLQQAGVRHVVLAPGSRNAPLSMALHRVQEVGAQEIGAQGIELHVRIDERSAAFLALGMARALEQPVAVVTTSGTAVANLAPAVMEANEASVPLVVLSADRPLTAMNSGASQTGHQFGLFAGQVRHQVQLTSDATPKAWRFQLRVALALATGQRTRRPGPVQVNLHLDEPLMPTEEGLDAPRPWQVEPSRPAAPVSLEAGPRTVVLAGDARPAVGQRAAQLAHEAGVPLLAEPSSNARVGQAISTYRLLLGKPDLGGQIEQVVVFGHPTLSRPVTRLLRRSDVEVVVVADDARWPDPGFTASRVVDDVELAPASDPSWLNRWLTADLDMQTRLQLAQRPEAGRDPRPTGLAVASLVVERTAGQVLVLGSSNPIRDADLARVPDALFGPQATPTTVFANRGLAGIDGVTSTAAGIALALDRPTTCLLGDLTFLHDAGGLWLGALERRPTLRLVVLDDRGGSIFHTLEQGAPEHEASFEKVFGTPHRTDLAALGAAHGWQSATVDDLAELGQRLRVPVRGPELLVVPVTRDDRRAWAERIAAF
ncbi:2-succinyl-5-enolpyruvyl-6-hydroxy-3-cyclohexene-1-carboxylic-acid synthase [Luteococcus sp. OSA5]|uniref:2-succinyl-5-enolpyruvyl-6-hydroxy-3- cyclohexene-1-carboxylic-acid synthase n=1 Tax=Luteococcus sp. OSA5 TaxID=3401630 RepID=UPI003B42FEA1